MSHEIIYQYEGFFVPPHESPDGQPRYLMGVEAGSSNTYTYANKRARDWQVFAVGSHDEVLRQVVRVASSCEGGMLQPGGKCCKPEYLIGKFRRLMKSATPADQKDRGWWRPVVTTVNPEMEADAVQLGAAIKAEPYYGSTRVRADFGTNLKAYFQFVSKHHMRVYGHQLAILGGLKAS